MLSKHFRDTCLSYYQLDPAHFYTAPGLSCEAALKTTGVNLELLTDIDKHLFFESGIRGGVSVISHRYAKANLSELPEYDENKPNQYLIYWDANNLNGWAMSQYLPIGGFHWLDQEGISSFNLENIKDDDDDDDVSYVLEVDMSKN